jgi:hypothetical protein
MTAAAAPARARRSRRSALRSAPGARDLTRHAGAGELVEASAVVSCDDAGGARAVQDYGSSPIAPVRARRTASAMADIRAGLLAIALASRPATVRQVFYRAVSAGLVAKSEQEYKGTVCRVLGDLRREGVLPFTAIADNTRWMRKPRSYGSLADALRTTQATYKRALWDDQDAYVEVWLEKDALAGVVYDITTEWDVPLMVSRGFASLSFLHAAAMVIASVGKPAHLYYVGDHDPSGIMIPKKIEATLRELAPGAAIHFHRIAVIPEQIAAWKLPTRPTKRTDARSRTFRGESVEADAIEPAQLRELVRNAIVKHIDQAQLARVRVAESAERETLAMMIARGLPSTRPRPGGIG